MSEKLLPYQAVFMSRYDFIFVLLCNDLSLVNFCKCIHDLIPFYSFLGGILLCITQTVRSSVFSSSQDYVFLWNWLCLLHARLEIAQTWQRYQLSLLWAIARVDSGFIRNHTKFLWSAIYFRKCPKSWRRASTNTPSLACQFMAALPASGTIWQLGSSSTKCTRPIWDGWYRFPGYSESSVKAEYQHVSSTKKSHIWLPANKFIV